ncbi:MAG: MarR family transcriptional regulator [Anaerolineae bacterium]|nr:MarR family transcriptional regulator [Anaerolineae bacterium]
MTISISREERIRAIKDSFHYLMWVALRQLTHLLQPFGLTFPQYITLASLAAHQQACPMRDLTNVTFQDPPTMTGIIDRLVKMELVQRSRSEVDRRIVLVEATPAGMNLVKRINAEMVQDALTGYARLSDDELAMLEQLFTHKLRMHVGRYKSLAADEWDAEIEKLRRFVSDPIHYAKLEDGKSP